MSETRKKPVCSRCHHLKEVHFDNGRGIRGCDSGPQRSFFCACEGYRPGEPKT